MNKKYLLYTSFLLLQFLIACSSPIVEPTATPIPTRTVTPSPTPLPSITAPNNPESGMGNIYGRVIKEGAPVANIPIILTGFVFNDSNEDYELYSEEQFTDEEGIFAFINLLPDDLYTIRINLSEDDYRLDNYLINKKQTELFSNDNLNLEDFYFIRTDLQLQSPIDQEFIAESQPLLEWGSYPEAAYYKGELEQESGNYTNMEFTTGETNYQMDIPLMECNYSWRITAFSEQDIPIASGIDSFKLRNEDLPNCLMALIYPKRKAQIRLSEVGVAWVLHPLAAYYKVQFRPKEKWGEGDTSICYPSYTNISSVLVEIAEDGSVLSFDIPDLSSAIGCPVEFTVYAHSHDDLILAEVESYFNLIR